MLGLPMSVLIRKYFISLFVAVIYLLNYAQASCGIVGCGGESEGTIDDYEVTFVEDDSGISYYELTGSYDKGNDVARQALLNKFYEDHSDDYDFIIVMTTFEFETDGATAFYNRIQNNVSGIGLSIVDFSESYGSDGKLLGLIDLAAYSQYALNPLDYNYSSLLTTTAHELLHQFGAFISYENSDGEISDDLIGYQGAHWSYYLDTDASVEYGSNWQDNGDGTFTAIGVRRFYSELDLYLMGFLPAEEVSDFGLIRSDDESQFSFPGLGDVISGTKEVISIDQVIAVEGERVPSYEDSQKQFDVGFIVLSRPDDSAGSSTKSGAVIFKQKFSERFAVMTGGEGILNVYSSAAEDSSVGEADTVEADEIREDAFSQDDAVTWLTDEFETGVGWLDTDHTELRDTIAATTYLLNQGESITGLDSVILELTSLTIESIESAYQLDDYISDEQLDELTEFLEVNYSDQPGWGISENYRSSVLDTAMAVRLIAQHGLAIEYDDALAFLSDSQGDNGSWSATLEGKDDVQATLGVILALSIDTETYQDSIDSGISFVSSELESIETQDLLTVSEALLAFSEVGQLDHLDLESAYDYLTANQGVNGSWNGSVYTTTTVLSALDVIDLPNVEISTVTLSNSLVSEGEDVTVSITVTNSGQIATNEYILSAYIGSVSSENLQEQLNVSALLSGESEELSFNQNTLGLSGDVALVLELTSDPYVEEQSLTDNLASANFYISAAPEYADFSIDSSELALIPEQPSSLPTTQGISLSVRNYGQEDAADVSVSLYEIVDSGTSTLLDTQYVDIPNRASQMVNLSSTVDRNGTIEYQVIVDAENLFDEAEEGDNSYEFSVSSIDSYDLNINADDFILDSAGYTAGIDQTITLSIGNAGTVRAEDVRVELTASSATTTEILFDDQITVPAGGSLEVEAGWAPTLNGNYTLEAFLDSENNFTEVDETNNEAEIEVEVAALEGINLVLDFNDISAEPETGVELSGSVITASVINTGTEASGVYSVRLYDSNPESGGTLIDEQLMTSLAGGDSTYVELIWSEIDTYGSRYLYVVIDDDDLVSETKEDDNSGFIEYSVNPSFDLSLNDSSVYMSPGYPAIGEDITLYTNVENLGGDSHSNISLSVYLTTAVNTTLLSTQTIDSIGSFELVEMESYFTATSDFASAEITVVVNEDQVDLEQDISNNSVTFDVDVQSSEIYVSESYISPNGDEVQDETTVFFSNPEAAANLYIAVESEADAEYVIEPASLANSETSFSWVWDGKDDSGSVVDDGDYYIQILDDQFDVINYTMVIVDNNRISIIDSIESGDYFIEETEIGSYNTYVVTEDSADIYFSESSDTDEDYSRGIYKYSVTSNQVETLISTTDLGIYYPRLMTANDSYFTYVLYEDSYDIDNIDSLYYQNILTGETIALSLSHMSEDYSWYDADYRASAYLTKIESFDTGILFSYDLGDYWWWDIESRTYTYLGASSTTSYYSMAEIDEDTLYIKLSDDYETSILTSDFTAGSLSEIDYIQSTASNGRVAKIYIDEEEWVEEGISYDFYAYQWIEGEISYRNLTVEIYDSVGNLVSSYLHPVEASVDVLVEDLEWHLNGSDLYFTLENGYYACNGGEPSALYTYNVDDNFLTKEFVEIPDGTWCGSFAVDIEGNSISDLHFPRNYERRKFRFNANNSTYLEVAFSHRAKDEAQVDSIYLFSDKGDKYLPDAIEIDGKRISAEVLYEDDYWILDTSNKEFVVIWDSVGEHEELTMSMLAREADIDTRTYKPVEFPRVKNSYFEIDAEHQKNTDLFTTFVSPDSGHPDAYVSATYDFEKDAGLNLYLDFGIDNTDTNHTDWARLYVRKDDRSQWVEYFLSADGGDYGSVEFSPSDKVKYPHKQYFFHISSSELPENSGQLQVRLQAYGSAGIKDILTQELLDEYEADDDGIPYVSFYTASTYTDPYTWVPNTNSIYVPFGVVENIEEETYDDFFYWGGYNTYGPVILSIDDGGEDTFQLFPGSYAKFASSGAFAVYGSNADYSIESTSNLTNDLQLIVSTNGESVLVSGTSNDKNFLSYEIEYRAYPDDDWETIKTSTTPVISDSMATFVPEEAGVYQVRLTTSDLAGNQLESIESIAWGEGSALTGFSTNYDYISPNNDDVQDEYIVDFTVLEPTTINVQVSEYDGALVREWSDQYDSIGTGNQVVWSGRDSSGGTVEDGLYTVSVNDIDFYVTVDNTAPVIESRDVLLASYDDDLAVVGLNLDLISSLLDDGEAYSDLIDETYLDDVSLEYQLFGDPDWEAVSGLGFSDSNFDITENSYRLVASDFAGNETRVNITSSRQNQLVMYQFGVFETDEENLDTFSALQTYIHGLSFDNVLDYGTDAYIGIVETIIDSVDSIRVEFSYWDSNDWSDWYEQEVTETYECSDLFYGGCSESISGISNSYVNMYLPVSDWPSASAYKVKVITEVDGEEIESDSFIFYQNLYSEDVQYNVEPEYNSETDEIDYITRDYSADSILLIESPNSDSWSSIEIYVSSTGDSDYVDTDYLQSTLIGSAISSYSLVDHTFTEFDIPQLKSCKQYEITAIWLDENGLEVGEYVTDVFVPCQYVTIIESSGYFYASSASSCNGENPEVLNVPIMYDGDQQPALGRIYTITEDDEEILQATTLDFFDYKLNGTLQFRYVNFQIDTSDFYHGELITLKAEVTDIDGEVSYDYLTVVIDKEPLTIEISYPAEGQNICPSYFETISDISDVEYPYIEINGLILDDFDGVDVSYLENHQLQELTISSSQMTNQYFLGYKSFPSELDLDSLPTLIAVPGSQNYVNGSLGSTYVDSYSGEVTLDFEVTDKSGYRVCTSRSFVLDAALDATISLSTQVFSPNYDGISDTLTMSYVSSEATEVLLEIWTAELSSEGGDEYEKGTLIRTLKDNITLPEGTNEFIWDGNDTAGQVVSDGQYIVYLYSLDGCSNYLELESVVTVDTTPPELEFVNISQGDTLALVTSIEASIADVSSSSYSLSVSFDNQESWQVLTSNAYTESGDVTASIDYEFNSWGLTGELYFKLQAEDISGNSSEIQISVYPSEETGPLQDFSLSPSLFSPNSDKVIDTTTVSYSITGAADITISYLDSENASLVTIYTDAHLTKGQYSFEWDGTVNGQLLDDSVFLLQIDAVDPDNDLLAQMVQLSVEVDTAVPAYSFASISNGFLDTDVDELKILFEDANLHEVSLEFTDSDGAVIESVSTEYDLGDSGWTSSSITEAISYNWTYENVLSLADDQYQIILTALDAAGNEITAIESLEKDTTAPAVTLYYPLSADVTGGDSEELEVSLNIEEVNLSEVGLVIEVDGELLEQQTLSVEQDGDISFIIDSEEWSEGSYSIELTATDKANNVTVFESDFYWDITPPTLTVDVSDNDFVNASAEFTGTASDVNLSSFQVLYSYTDNYDIDSATPIYLGSTNVVEDTLFTWNDLPADGEYRMYFLAEDELEQYTSAQRVVNVDTEAPMVPEVETASAEASLVTLDWLESESQDVSYYRIYQGESLIVDESTELSWQDELDDGLYEFSVTAVDYAGNESEPSEVSITIDTKGPTVLISSPVNDSTVNGVVDIYGTASSDDDFESYSLLVSSDTQPEIEIASYTLARTSELLVQWNTSELEDDTYVVNLYANDVNGNVSEYSVSVIVDNTPPDAPTGLVISAADSDVTLSWDENSETDLVGYLVFLDDTLYNQDGVLVGSMLPYAIDETELIETVADGDHEFVIYAIDKAGNISLPSDVIAISVETRSPVTEFSTPIAGDGFDATLYIDVTSEDEDIILTQISLRQSGETDWVLIAELQDSSESVSIDTTDFEYATYELMAESTDSSGNVELDPPVITVERIDLVAPTQSGTVSAIATGSTVNLAWTEATDTTSDDDVSGYLVYRKTEDDSDYEYLDSVTGSGSLTYVDSGLDEANYLYQVVAEDSSGNISNGTESDVAAVFSLSVGTIPGYTSDSSQIVSVSSPRSGELQLTSTNTLTADAYNLTAVTEEGYEITVSLEEAENELSMVLVDDLGNTSITYSHSIYRYDAPAKVEGLVASVDGYEVQLSWTENSETNIAGYEVFRDGESSRAITPISISYSGANNSYQDIEDIIDGDTSTSWLSLYGYDPIDSYIETTFDDFYWFNSIQIDWPYTSCRFHTFTVNAYQGDELVESFTSAGSEEEVIFPYSAYADKLQLVFVDRDSSCLILRISDITYSTYEFVEAAEYTDTDVSDETYEYQVRAINEYNLSGEKSDAISVDVGDHTAPVSIVLTAMVDETNVELSWESSVSTDVSDYYIYRDDVLIATEPETGEATYNYADADLANATYSYYVVARDAVGLASDPSNIETVTVEIDILDAPVLESVDVADDYSVNLIWSHSDDTSVSNYQLYRKLVDDSDYSLIDEVTSTDYNDASVEIDYSYQYFVTAVDAYGNDSESSNVLTISVLDTDTPDVPIFTAPVPDDSNMVVVSEASVDLEGSTSAGADVYLYSGGSYLDTVTATTTSLASAYSITGANADYLYIIDDQFLLMRGVNSDWSEYQVYSLAQEEFVQSYSAYDYSYDDFSFTDDSVYSVDDDQVLYRYSLETDSLTVVDLGLTDDEGLSYFFASKDDRYALIYVEYDSSGDETLELINLETYERTLILEDASDIERDYVLFSPDSSYVIWSDDRVLTLLYVDSLEQTTHEDIGSFYSSNYIYNYTDWNDDGDQLLLKNSDGDISVFDPETLENQVISDLENSYYSIYWNDQSDTILAMSTYGYYYEIDPLTGTETFLMGGDDTDYWYLIDLGSGDFIFWDYNEETFQIYVPPGYFSYESLELDEGENLVTAISQDSAGNLSDISDVLIVDYQLEDAFDLSLEDMDDILAFVVDETNVLPVLVTNDGELSAPASTANIYIYTNEDYSLVYETSLSYQTIDINETATAYLSWSPTVSGDYTLVIELVADSDEYNESNNSRIFDVEVLAEGSVMNRLSTNYSSYSSSDDVYVDASLYNTGSTLTGEWRIEIQDASGDVVEVLYEDDSLTLSVYDYVEQSLSWDAGDVYAGDYQAVQYWQDTSGSSSESSVEFEILEEVNADMTISVNQDEFLANETVQIITDLERTNGNFILTGSELTLTISDETDDVVSEFEDSVSAMLPSGSFEVVNEWQTGTLTPGIYTITAYWYSEAGELISSLESQFEILESEVSLYGSLDIDELTVTNGTVLAATIELTNFSNFAISDAVVRISSAALLETYEQDITLAVEGSVSIPVSLELNSPEPDEYPIYLVCEVDGEVYEIDSNVLTAIDTSQPDVEIFQPVESEYLGSDQLTAIAEASDEDSPIDSVEISIDEADWSAMILDSEGYSASLATYANGSHTIQVRATDTAGITTTLDAYEFVIDTQIPVIEITGISEGDYYNTEVTPAITVTDDNLTLSEYSLNGELWVPETLTDEGSYIVSVEAEDLAGNSASEEVSFAIDATAPEVTITGAEDGGLYNETVQLDISISDANLLATDVSVNGEAYSSLAPSFSDDGIYEITVSAIDSATNQTDITLSFEIDATAPQVPVISSPESGATLDTSEVDLTGTAEALSTIYIYVADELLVSTVTDAAGEFSLVSVSLSEGANEWTVYADDAAGNRSEALDYSLTLQTETTVELDVSLNIPDNILVYAPLDKGYWWRQQNCLFDRNQKTYYQGFVDGWQCNPNSNTRADSVNSDSADQLLKTLGIADTYELDTNSELYTTLVHINDYFTEQGTQVTYAASEFDFSSRLRSQQYGQVWILDLNDRHGYGADIKFSLVSEVAAVVAGGTGLVVIGTEENTNASPDWYYLTGMTDTGTSVTASSISFDENPVVEAVTYSYQSDAALVQVSENAVGYGSIGYNLDNHGAKTHDIDRYRSDHHSVDYGSSDCNDSRIRDCQYSTWPALVVNKYGLGNVASFAFNPALLEQQYRESLFTQLSVFSQDAQTRDYESAVIAFRSTVQPASEDSVDVTHYSEQARLLHSVGFGVIDSGNIRHGNFDAPSGSQRDESRVTWTTEGSDTHQFESLHLLSFGLNEFNAYVSQDNVTRSEELIELDVSISRQALEEYAMNTLAELQAPATKRNQHYEALSNLQWCISLKEKDQYRQSINNVDPLMQRLHRMAAVTNSIVELDSDNIELISAAAQLYRIYAAEWVLIRSHNQQIWPHEWRWQWWFLPQGRDQWDGQYNDYDKRRYDYQWYHQNSKR
jgi:flagellar hook assembly protein FlgD/fibronectin type 3 domain-containing protein